MCDIVECETILDSKTSTIIDVSFDTDEILSSFNGTPKQLIASRFIKNGNEEINNDQVDLDSTNESIFSVDITKTVRVDDIYNRIVTNKQGESNAFQVLMERSKQLKCLSPRQSILEEEISTAKDNSESKLKLNHSKDKLVTMTNKKRSSKRKLIEKEEDVQKEIEEKVEKPFLDRSKIFRRTNLKNLVHTIPSNSNQKIFTQDLHNYFSKITAEEQEKKTLLQAPNIIDDADEHNTGAIVSAEPFVPQMNANSMKLKTRQVLGNIDDIQILRTKTSPLIETVELGQIPEHPSQLQRRKPKWSLQINLQSFDDDCNIIDDALRNGKKRTRNSATDTDKRITKKVHMNKKSKKQEKIQNCNKIVDVNVNNSVHDTNNSLLVDSNEIKDIFKTNHDLSVDTLLKNDYASDTERTQVKKSFNEKLAPLFMKRIKPDPKVIEARRLFLHSRSPENEKKKSRLKSHISTISILPFPSVSHVSQLNIDTHDDNSYDNIKFRMKQNSVYVPTLDYTDMKYVNCFTDTTKNQPFAFDQVKKINIDAVLHEIEQCCPDAREIWQAISLAANKLNHQFSPKKRVQKRKSVDKNINQNDNRTDVFVDTWTQKYRPLNGKQVIGNEEATLKLQNWLKAWKLSANKTEYSSSEEFYCSDNSYDNYSETNQVAVLSGPYGSGKTASVYAIAEEFGYNVIEVNASSKRSGKKILKELEEATKSHRVKKIDSQIIAQPIPMKEKNMLKNSLILLEDVDLIFDEDEGFISAVNQLSSNTRRPIVLTCRDSCSHLSRMASQQLRICFQRISGSRAIALIQLIALAETGTRIPRPYVEKLIVNGDLRKALLELQYLLLSRGAPAMKLSSSFDQTLWQDMRSSLYKPIIEIHKRNKKEKSQHVLKTAISSQASDKSLVSLAHHLDIISLVASLININDCTLNMSRVKHEPNVSLEENMDLYSNNNGRSIDISEWLTDKIMNKYVKEHHEISATNVNQLLTKKELTMNVNLAFSQVSNTLDTRILSIDYIPTIRTICRVEATKVNNNMKRRNRFFHYLQNLRIPATFIRPNILAAACKMMQERMERNSKH